MPAPEPVPTGLTSVEGCLSIGDYDRVVIFQRDDEHDMCASLVFVTPEDDENPFDLTSLSLPPRWTVEEMSAFPCAPDGSMLDAALPSYFMAATGTVDFVMGQGGLPNRASLDVMLMNPLDDAAALPYPDPPIMGQLISAEDLELAGGCPLR
jgi:hypothetical protein